mgnify:CR=1 FL=1
MENNSYFKDYRSFRSFNSDRCGKSTLFENEFILAGLNCLNPGQSMEKHAHDVQNRFYLVLEGEGLITLNNETNKASQGMVIWVPSGCVHKINNNGEEQMVLLVGISPAHSD